MIELRPIGTVRSELTKPSLRADSDGITLEQRLDEARERHRKVRSLVSEIVLDEDLSPLLDGIEGFSHILVLFWPHLVPEERRSLTKVRPMGRKEFPEVGVLSSCSPARPNPVLVTAVRLLARVGNRLRVQGLEAVDGTPVVDVKPYNPDYYRVDDATVPEWMECILREMRSED